MSYGSEFRPAHILEPLFQLHPLWPRMKKILMEGVNFPLDNFPWNERKKDLKEALVFGNHKKALKMQMSCTQNCRRK